MWEKWLKKRNFESFENLFLLTKRKVTWFTVYWRKWETFNLSFWIFGDGVICTVHWTIYVVGVVYTGRCMEILYYVLEDVWRCCTMYWTIPGVGILCTGQYMGKVNYIHKQYREMVYCVLDDKRCWCNLYWKIYGDVVLDTGR